MPEIIRYVVQELREVTVTANNVEDAARIAAAAFEFGQNSDNGVKKTFQTDARLTGIYGNTHTKIKTIHLLVERR